MSEFTQTPDELRRRIKALEAERDLLKLIHVGTGKLALAATDTTSEDAEKTIAALRSLGADIPTRLNEAVALEAASVPHDLVMWAARVASVGVVRHDDIRALDQIIPVEPFTAPDGRKNS